jgi:hypothetical protein
MVQTWCSTLSVNYTKRVRIVAWRQTSESRHSLPRFFPFWTCSDRW